MKQIITRLDDELAQALKDRARSSGESVNAYVNRLLRAAVVGPDSPRQRWKAAAIASGLLMDVPARRRSGTDRDWNIDFTAKLLGGVKTPAGYASDLVSKDRDER